jgi:uncharacterized membrane protein
MPQVKKSVTVMRPRDEVYEFWRDFARLPTFMIHLERVTVAGGGRRSRWVAKSPGGQVEWDAELLEDRPNELVSWRSLPGSDITNAGSVRFVDAPADRGTEVHVELTYEPASGRAGTAVAKLFGEEPLQQLRDDLRRFKQVMETGEVVRSDGSLEGAGQGVSKQRAAQAVPAGEVRS